MTPFARSPFAAAALLWLGSVAASERWLVERRPAPPELRASLVISVTSEKDGGPGSLREAVFAADRAGARARIELRVKRIVLATPLPAFVNPKGVVVDCPDADCEIQARDVTDAPVLDLAAPGSVVRGLRISGSSAQGILVRAGPARLLKVSVADCAEGVHLVDGAVDLLVEDSLLEQNGIGVRLPSTASGVTLRRNQFRKHEQGAVWAVRAASGLPASPDQLIISGNRFEEDRISVLVINVPGRIEDNDFVRAGEAALYLTGGGVVKRNRIRSGSSSGIFADAPHGARIEDNEVDHNFAVGILLREARDTVVQGNRVHQNGYGIATVFGSKDHAAVVAQNLILGQREDGLFVVGGSPLLQENRSLGNQGAALRVLDFVPVRGPRIVAEPVLKDNTLIGSSGDAVVRGEYRARDSQEGGS